VASIAARRRSVARGPRRRLDAALTPRRAPPTNRHVINTALDEELPGPFITC